MLETTHYNNSSVSVLKNSQHLYLIGGYVFDLTENTKFKPAILSKVSFGAPLQLDFSANFYVQRKICVGGAYRWSAAVSVMAGFQINDRWLQGMDMILKLPNCANTTQVHTKSSCVMNW